MDRKKFYDSLRPHVNLTTQNVEGMEKVLDYAKQYTFNVNRLAYIIATAWWETAQTMHPIKEAYWLSESWRRRHLRYYPWYGRGLIQTTWKDNYRKMSPVVGTDLIKNPDALLEWKYALPALFIGMQNGMYTGKSLEDYIDDIDESDAEDSREYKNARRIVNGTDKAPTIAKLALHFERALKAGKYKPSADKPPITEDGILLKKGHRGPDVAKLIQDLHALGYYHSTLDDYFWNATEAAVRSFQLDQGLVVDGVVGPKTRAAIQAALSVSSTKSMVTTAAASGIASMGATSMAGYDWGVIVLVGVSVAIVVAIVAKLWGKI